MKNYSIKRVICLLLAAVLTFGNIPAPVFAAEEEIPAETETIAAEETAAEATEATEETSAPTEPPVPETEAAAETVPETEPAVEAVPDESQPVAMVEEETVSEEAVNATITDYSNYTFQLRPADAGGYFNAVYVNSRYFNYSWYSPIELYSGMSSNERFVTRVHFEKDNASGKYRLYLYGVHKGVNGSTDPAILNANKYYLKGATFTNTSNAEAEYFFYGSEYGYKYLDVTRTSSNALLWEVTSSGYLKTTYNGSTHYLWTTSIPYGSNVWYTFRLRTSTTAKGNRGMVYDLDDLSYDFYSESKYHTHIPSEKQVTSTDPANCVSAARTYQSIFCTNADCGAALASNSYTSGSRNPDNHTELAERVANEQPANCLNPHTYNIEVYCTGCWKVIETKGPFQEGEPIGHTYENGVCTACGTGEKSCGANLTWTLIDGVLTISGTGPMKICYNDTDVPWKNLREQIIHAVIEDGVTSVSAYAFYNCSSLVSVTLPDSVTGIGESAFRNCSGLTSIEIPEGVTSIEESVFYGCSSLTGIEIPDSVTTIGFVAFSGCSSLAGITIPNSVTDIGVMAFYKCSGLTSLVIPDSVTSIGSGAFSGCSSLASVMISKSLTSISDSVFRDCSSLTNITIPNSVTGIGEYAFANSGLTSLVIPDSVTSIGERAFENCTSLKSIVIPKSVTTMGYHALDYCKLADLYYGSTEKQWRKLNVWPFYDRIHYSCTNPENHWRTQVTPGTCTEAGRKRTYCSCGHEIIEAITYAHEYENGICTVCGTGEVSCGENLTWTLIDGVLTISGTGSMDDYSSYSGTHAPWKKSSDSIRRVVIKDGVADIGDEAFYQCANLTSAEISDTVTSIGVGAFYQCSSLTNLNIPNSVTYLGGSAFYGCSSLTSIEIPDSVTKVGQYVFEDCTGLKNVKFGNGLTETNTMMFRDCTALENVVLSASLNVIEYQTFRNCTSLKSIVIPNSGTKIYDGAFMGCSLTDVYFGGTAEQWLALSNRPDAEYIHTSCTDYENHWKIESTAPTCTEDGIARKYCDCGYEVDKVINGAALGHDMSDWVIITEATCTVDGEQSRKCRRCDYVESDVIEADHTYENGVCTVCGAGGESCGDNLYWTLVDGVLTISGDGPMYHYSSSYTPWSDYRSVIKSVVIEDGVTSIGNYAFWYCSNLTSIEIPAGVSGIGNFAFGYCVSLTSIEIPAGVSSIGGWAFRNCSSLTSINIPDGLSKISDGTFCDCSSLTSIKIPDSVTGIGVYVFYGCSSLTSIEMPDGVTRIGEYVFYDCSSLTSIELPDSVTSIGYRAFYGCSSLTSIEIPAGVALISSSAFDNCSSLRDVYYGGTAEQWIALGEDALEAEFIHYSCTNPENHWKMEIFDVTCTEDGYTGERCVCGYERNKVITEIAPGHDMGDWTVTVEATCTVDGEQRRECGRCDYVETEVLKAPGHTVVIDEAVDPTCTETGLTEGKHCEVCGEILVAQEIVAALGHGMGEWFVEVEETCTADGTLRRNCSRCDYFETDIIPAAHKFEGGSCVRCDTIGGTCGENVFWTLIDGVLTIYGSGVTTHWQSNNNYPPEKCTYAPWYERRMDIKSVVIEDGVTIIGCYAFYDCSNLTEIDLPDGFIGVADWTFYKCTSLKNITLPDNATFIYNSFDECTSLEGIWVSDTHEEYRNDEFGVVFTKDMSKLLKAPGGLSGHYEIPAGVKEIDLHAFRYCRNVESVTIPDGVTFISAGAFLDCSSLESIEIPESVTGISAYAFGRCSSLKNIKLPSGLEFISMDLFTNCTSLTSVVISDGTKLIDNESFEGCTSLESIVIPASVTLFGGDAFLDCDNIKDVYYGGTAEQWIALGGGVPKTEFIHYTCTDYETHWKTVTVDATCTTDGYTYEHCACGYERDRTTTEEAFGHTEVIDEAVAPNCSETGLTEGKHCETCGEIFIAQEVLPIVGHSFEEQGEQLICSVCDEELKLRIAQDYILMDRNIMNQAQLALEVSPAHLADEVQWTIEGEEGVVTVDQYGAVTALKVGTAYVVATLTYGEYELITRCRIDVSQWPQIAGIQLDKTAVTTELYSTAYAEFEILLKLPQNNQFAAIDGEIAAKDLGIAIERACFEDENLAKLFNIHVLDDRTVQIVPTDYAVNNPGFVGKKYTGRIKVMIQGTEYISETLTLTVKKTLPKLKATVAAFNSFYSGQSQQITITGGTATKVYPNPAQKAALPNWLTLSEDGTLTLNEQAPLKSASAKAYILVDTAEWRIPAAVTLSIKNTYKARGLKLSASSVTFTTLAENSNGVAMQLLCTGKNETLADLNVTGITAPAGYTVENFNIADGSFTLKALSGFKAGTINLGVTFSDTAVEQPLKLTVKTAKVTLKASSTKVTLNTGRNDSAVIDITATPADYQITDPVITLTGTELVNGKKTTVDKLNSGELDIAFEDGKIKIATTSKTPDKASYKISISAGGSKAVTITISTVSAVPSVTFKASGSMDLSFPNQSAVITPTFKNCGGGFDSFEYTVSEMKGKTVVNENVTNAFEVVRDGNVLKVRCIDETVSTSNTYVFKLKLILKDGSSVENTINLKVKRTAVKLKLSTTKLTLNKLIGDKATVDVSCTTKGYDFTEPVLELKDSKNNSAAGQLDVNFNNGKLTIATNDATVYGASYKLLVKANEYAAASTITITIPKLEKSNVTVSLKASGKLDVIRDGSAITVTPSYKNCFNLENIQEELFIYSSEDGYTRTVNHLFSIEPNGKGGYLITKADGAALIHGPKYKVKVVTTFEKAKAESALASMTVTMGSTKLTLKAADTMLFAQDKHDRVVFSFNAADKTLNKVAKVEIKDVKYKDMFEVYDYGNGEFAIGFKDETVSEKLIGKKATLAVTLNLNVFVEGNETAKVNTTAKIKLTIVK